MEPCNFRVHKRITIVKFSRCYEQVKLKSYVGLFICFCCFLEKRFLTVGKHLKKHGIYQIKMNWPSCLRILNFWNQITSFKISI